jgi:hypothetical protein
VALALAWFRADKRFTPQGNIAHCPRLEFRLQAAGAFTPLCRVNAELRTKRPLLQGSCTDAPAPGQAELFAFVGACRRVQSLTYESDTSIDDDDL